MLIITLNSFLKMKHLNLFFLLFVAIVSAQNDNIAENIIYVTNNKTTTIVFDDNIQRGVPGNKKITFGYDTSSPSPVALMRGVKGPETNIMVITENGNLYDFTVRFAKDLTPEQKTVFVKDSLAQGNIFGSIVYKADILKKQADEEAYFQSLRKSSQPLMINDNSGEETVVINKEEKEKEDLLYETDKNEYIRKYASNQTTLPTYYRRKFASNSKIYLHLKNLAYNKDEMYFSFIVENTTNLDYDIKNLSVYMVSKEKKKSTSSQRIPIKPIMIYNQPDRINGNGKKTFVYVFDKFSIGNKKSIEVEMNESRGERNIILRLDDDTVNNPNG